MPTEVLSFKLAATHLVLEGIHNLTVLAPFSARQSLVDLPRHLCICQLVADTPATCLRCLVDALRTCDKYISNITFFNRKLGKISFGATK